MEVDTNFASGKPANSGDIFIGISSTIHPICEKKDANKGEDAQNHCNHLMRNLKRQFLY